MKRILIATAALALAACATVDKPASPAPALAQAASGTYFCWKERLATEGANLVCNWEANVNDACRSHYNTPISKASVSAGPSDARRCENGQWLVQVTTR